MLRPRNLPGSCSSPECAACGAVQYMRAERWPLWWMEGCSGNELRSPELAKLVGLPEFGTIAQSVPGFGTDHWHSTERPGQWSFSIMLAGRKYACLGETCRCCVDTRKIWKVALLWPDDTLLRLRAFTVIRGLAISLSGLGLLAVGRGVGWMR